MKQIVTHVRAAWRKQSAGRAKRREQRHEALMRRRYGGKVTVLSRSQVKPVKE